MIEIEYTNETNANDRFHSEHIYIEQLYLTCDEEYDKLELNEKRELNHDSVIGKDYLPIKHCYINSRQTFESICDLGKIVVKDTDEQILLNNPIKNINELDRGNLKDEISKYVSLINKWIELNFYPYSNFNKADSVFTFLNDCVLCYAIYDIHKWLIKISNNINAIAKKPYKSKELKNLNKAIQFINLADITQANDLNNVIVNLPDQYFQLDDHATITTIDFTGKTHVSKDYIMNYCNTIRRNLIGYITSIIKSRLEDFNITKLQPFYEPKDTQYRTIETASSAIGVAYYRLLFSLTSNSTAFNRVICLNEDCNNEIIKNGRREWCKNYECQKARNRHKNQEHYENKKKQKQVC